MLAPMNVILRIVDKFCYTKTPCPGRDRVLKR